MRTNTSVWAGLVAIVVVSLVACGEAKSPTADTDASAPHEPSPSASSESREAASAAPSASTTAPPSLTGEISKPGTITMDDDDGCTKLAAAFEQKARPKIKECYREGKKTNGALEGGVRISIAVDGFGKLGEPKTQDVTLPDAVVKCMVKAVHDTPFDDASKCKRKGITLPIQFPTK